MTTSVVKEAGNATSVGDNRAHSNEGSRENEYSNDTPLIKRRGLSSSQMVDLVFSILSFIFILFSFYFLIFLFLEHRVRVRVRSQDIENEVEESRTNDVIQHGYHMLTSCSTHGHLG